MKSVSKAVVNGTIKDEHFDTTLMTDEKLYREVKSIRSFKDEIYSYVVTKVALTSYYDKMRMVDAINCTPFGYYKSGFLFQNI